MVEFTKSNLLPIYYNYFPYKVYLYIYNFTININIIYIYI